MLTKNKASKVVYGKEYILAEANAETVRHSVVSTFHTRPSDPTDAQVLGLIEQSGVLDFWNRDEEDVYTHEDGEPI